MRALATQNNIEGETRLEMSFWDKVHIFLQLVGEEVIIQERERWFSEFKKLCKGKNKRPDGFTTYIRKLTCQLASEKQED